MPETGMIEKNYIRVPAPYHSTILQKAMVGAMGLLLSPLYWFAAFLRKAPGLEFRGECAKLGLKLLCGRRNLMPGNFIYYCLFGPMDSTRYFEFDVLWDFISEMTFSRYLDVSSPRLFPTIVMDRKPQAMAHLINPDVNDLRISKMLIQSVGMQDRCQLHDCIIANAPFPEESFDLITSISVIEHIPDDRGALQKMWSLLKPGGRLLITVPCAASASEQYIDRYEYGILPPDENNSFFWQRFYDSRSLSERLFTITGSPTRQVIYGEKHAGSFQKNAAKKRADRYYPLWKEPYMMACEYCRYESIEELPGEGVVALEFYKY